MIMCKSVIYYKSRLQLQGKTINFSQKFIRINQTLQNNAYLDKVLGTWILSLDRIYG